MTTCNDTKVRVSNEPRKMEMPLIFVNGIRKAEPEKRKQIRKYVMMGKNRGKTRKAKPPKTTSQCDPGRSSEDQDGSSSLSIKMQYPVIPNKVGSELSFTQFAAPIEPSLMRDVLKFSLMSKKVMYPLESCIQFHRENKVDTIWFDLMTYDAVYMHAIVFSSQVYSSRAYARGNATAARWAVVHHSTTLQLLRERLAAQDEDAKVSDSTIFVVLCLANIAHFISDYESARHHLEGLRKIVDLRGGIYAFSYNTKLTIELLKCDLGIAIYNGTNPLFFRDPSLEPLVPYELASPTAQGPDSSKSKPYWNPTPSTINADLIRAWTVMTRFCSTINSAAKHGRRLPKETLLNATAAIMYRILRMDNLDPASMDEAVRLGLLAFASHIFLNYQGVKPSHTYLPETYRRCLISLELVDTSSSYILLWLLMVGGMALFDPMDDVWLLPWVQANIKLCGAHDWNELRDQLKTFPWIDILHDKPGQAIFDAAVSERVG